MPRSVRPSPRESGTGSKRVSCTRPSRRRRSSSVVGSAPCRHRRRPGRSAIRGGARPRSRPPARSGARCDPPMPARAQAGPGHRRPLLIHVTTVEVAAGGHPLRQADRREPGEGARPRRRWSGVEMAAGPPGDVRQPMAGNGDVGSGSMSSAASGSSCRTIRARNLTVGGQIRRDPLCIPVSSSTQRSCAAQSGQAALRTDRAPEPTTDGANSTPSAPDDRIADPTPPWLPSLRPAGPTRMPPTTWSPIPCPGGRHRCALQERPAGAARRPQTPVVAAVTRRPTMARRRGSWGQVWGQPVDLCELAGDLAKTLDHDPGSARRCAQASQGGRSGRRHRRFVHRGHRSPARMTGTGKATEPQPEREAGKPPGGPRVTRRAWNRTDREAPRSWSASA